MPEFICTNTDCDANCECRQPIAYRRTDQEVADDAPTVGIKGHQRVSIIIDDHGTRPTQRQSNDWLDELVTSRSES